jgi:ankyrin repeat protein
VRKENECRTVLEIWHKPKNADLSKFKLHRAISTGDIRILHKHLRSVSHINKPDPQGWTALHCAIHARQFDVGCLSRVRLFLILI